MISLMAEKRVFTIEDIAAEIGRLVMPSPDVTAERIEADVSALVGVLKTKGWVCDG